MLLTQYYVETAWSHDSPRQFTKEYFMEALKRLKLDKLVSDDELELYSNFTLSEFIKVSEEFLHSDSLHYNHCSKSLFNISWIISNINSLLRESILKDVNFFSWSIIETSRSCGGLLW